MIMARRASWPAAWPISRLAVSKSWSSRPRWGFYEGDSAAFAYGGVRGFGRFIFRMGAGFWEVLSFPFATNKGTYKPPYRSNIPWIHGGYEEFPPELGFESHYRYSAEYSSNW